jgi:hypothetical protein
MILRTGDMFESPTDVLLVTTNAYVRTDGGLVMGRGAAYQCTQKYPGSQAEFGKLVTEFSKIYPKQPYGILASVRWQAPMLGIFQVKYHFRDDADIGLIENSVKRLSEWASANLTVKFSLNFPGIGNGRLQEKRVLPMLAPLPDNVEVWKRV